MSHSSDLVPRLLSRRFVYENNNMSSPKVYVLQPWIVNLLVNYEQLDATENLLAGQVLRVGTEGNCPEVLQQCLTSKFREVFSSSQFGDCGWASSKSPIYSFFFEVEELCPFLVALADFCTPGRCALLSSKVVFSSSLALAGCLAFLLLLSASRPSLYHVV